MISMKEILGTHQLHNLPKPIQDNVLELYRRVNILRHAYGRPLVVTSGYRSSAHNIAVGGAPMSKHLIGCAIDVADVPSKGKAQFWQWLMANMSLCYSTGIWLEDKRWTPTWVHMQIQSPGSGNRVFVPNNSKAKAPELWDGSYDSDYNGHVGSYEVNN